MNAYNLSYIILKFPLTLPLRIKNVPADSSALWVWELDRKFEKKEPIKSDQSVAELICKSKCTYWLSGKLISKKSIFQNPDIIFSSYFLNATINYYVLWRKIASKLLNHFPIVQITDQIFPPVSFSSSQQNLIKTFQIEAMIALITKMVLIFS